MEKFRKIEILSSMLFLLLFGCKSQPAEPMGQSNPSVVPSNSFSSPIASTPEDPLGVEIHNFQRITKQFALVNPPIANVSSPDNDMKRVVQEASNVPDAQFRSFLNSPTFQAYVLKMKGAPVDGDQSVPIQQTRAVKPATQNKPQSSSINALSASLLFSIGIVGVIISAQNFLAIHQAKTMPMHNTFTAISFAQLGFSAAFIAILLQTLVKKDPEAFNNEIGTVFIGQGALMVTKGAVETTLAIKANRAEVESGFSKGWGIASVGMGVLSIVLGAESLGIAETPYQQLLIDLTPTCERLVRLVPLTEEKI